MKYWKQFWGGLNLGWRRIHYIVFIPIGIMTVGSWLLMYFLLITLIYWIKEGFDAKKGEPTNEG